MRSVIISFVLLILSCYYVDPSSGGRYNVSMGQLDTCDEYNIHAAAGYRYLDFFQVHTLDNNNLAPDETLHLKFYVLTAMDAHILLSQSDHPLLRDKVYEIVIGAGSNSFSAVRINMGRRRVATNQDPQLLSIHHPTPIEIVQKRNGTLLVYIPGFKEEAIMSYADDTPLAVNYISFSTFGSITARWFYDCEFDGFAAEMKQEERILSPRQRLIANITEASQNKTMPPLLDTVGLAFQVHALSYKQDISVLHTRMELLLYWDDSRLVWNASDFDGNEVIVEPTMEIWTPQIIVLNGALETLRNFHPQYSLKVHSDGRVVMVAKEAELTTWCPNSLIHWPYERMRCIVALGTEEFSSNANDQLRLQYDPSAATDEPLVTMTEWRFLETEVRSYFNRTQKRFSDDGIQQTMDGDLSIAFVVERNSQFYSNVFSVPVCASHSLIVLSFLLRGYRRGALILVVFVIAALGLMFISKYAPSTYVPNLMFAYQNVMYMCVFCYCLHIAIMWLELFPPKSTPGALTLSIINNSAVRFILCRRISDADEYVAIQEYPWRDIAKMLNNVSFTIINVLLILGDVFLLS